MILGKPGAGKGSLCSVFIEKENLCHISTGDIFRKEIASKSELGILADSYISKGQLCPDDVTNKIIEKILKKNPDKSYLFDGYPRTVNQAQDLEKSLKSLGKNLDACIDLTVPDDLVILRLTSRRVCSNCQAIYNVRNHNPKVEGVCDICGGKVITRDDDKIEAITKRLSVYEKQTRPLVDYYASNGLLIEVDGSLDSDVLYLDVKKKLNSKNQKNI